MNDQSISKSYASALFQLGKEKNIDITDEIIKLNELIAQSSDLENVLFLEAFTPEEKWSVLSEVLNKLNASVVLKNFLAFIVAEKRLGIFPMIFKDLVVLDDDDKGFLRGTIEGFEAQVNEKFKTKILSFLKLRINKEIKLEYVQNEDITAGYKITVDDLQLDASLDNQLNKLKETVLN